MFTLFISDLHLSEHTDQLTEWFLKLLATYAKQADALYILGDLFEVWIGDDEQTAYNNGISRALKELSLTTPIYFIAGNRDFMLGEDYAKRAGLTLLADPTVINLYQRPTLLTHGDFLCSQDKHHIAFRRFTQKSWVQKALLSLPLAWRYKLAKGLREKSKLRTQRLDASYMDIDQQALIEMMRCYKVSQLLHGHTHRPSIAEFCLDGQRVRHAVLSDWDERGHVLIYHHDHRLRLCTLDKVTSSLN